MAGQEVEVCELISNFQQYSTAFERLSPRLVPRCYLCVFEVRGVREDWGNRLWHAGGMGRDSPARLKLTAISSLPKDT